MFGIPITSWKKLVADFAQELDVSNFESRPYVDLTDQSTGTHVNPMYGDPTCEEGLNGHELVEIEPKDSHEGYELMSGSQRRGRRRSPRSFSVRLTGGIRSRPSAMPSRISASSRSGMTSRTRRSKNLRKSVCAITALSSRTARSSARSRRTSPCSSARWTKKGMRRRKNKFVDELFFGRH